MRTLCGTIMVGLSLCCSGVFASEYDVTAAIVHNTIGYASGYWLARFVGRFAHLGEAEARTVAIEVGMQNGGMAGALAVGVLGSAVAALPANVFSIWMDFSGSILANFWSRHQPGGE